MFLFFSQQDFIAFLRILNIELFQDSLTVIITSPQEKEKLKLMSSTCDEGKMEYQKWIVNDVRSIVHILEDLPSCKPPLDHICELLPRLQARYYSISSSGKVEILRNAKDFCCE